jgi:hypothetical protein
MRRSLLIILLLIVSLVTGLTYLYSKRNIGVTSTVSTDVSTTKAYVSPISIDYLRSLQIKSEKLIIEEKLSDGSNYKRFIASYISEGNKIYGLLTVPKENEPASGFPAIVFCHGYIPPKQYVTTNGYVSYVDYLATRGFVVFKIDFRGNGNSEGD